MSILKAENIYKSYTDTQKRVDVLEGINLSIIPGESLAIVGPSGAGKSTLLHVIGGLDHPDKGRVLLDGKDLYKMNDAERSRVRNQAVGFVFQFYHLLPELTALENVLMPLMVGKNVHGVTPEIEGMAAQRLKEMGLEARLEHKPAQLSGGEQQRVAIARALANDPAILLCDEPTGNLDSRSGDAVIDLLLSSKAKAERTIVIVTHDIQIAKRCGRTVHIKDGVLE
ncbi:MAG: ABC transporter ATP-binding protein [Candidatus Omnitrophica bacterium]|nr:ABC transporter ATP-binding protein [Candidatus Omnitrophota bacterium]